MCGIAGIIPSNTSIQRMLEQALEMRRRLQNRGPDDWGVGLGVSPPATDLRLPSNVTVFQSARPIAIGTLNGVGASIVRATARR